MAGINFFSSELIPFRSTSHLRFEHQIGLDFLAELLKWGLPPYSVVKAEWEKLILKHEPQDIMETVNWSSVICSKYYFINDGNKVKLRHCSLDQYDAKRSLNARQLFIIEKQQKILRQESKALVAFCLYKKSSTN